MPCKHLFSAGGEIATKCQAQLGATHFEELSAMKFVWRNNIGDIAAWNMAQVEEVVDHEMSELQDLLAADGEHEEWDKDADEFVSCF